MILYRGLLFLGLAILVAVPLAYSRRTYEPAYLKTFLFQASAIALFLGYLLAQARSAQDFLCRPRWTRSPATPMVAWLAWNLASAAWAISPPRALERASDIALLVFLGFGCANAFRDARLLRRSLWVLGGTLSIAAVFAIWLYSQAYEQFLPALFSNRELAANFFYLPAGLALSAALTAWSEKSSHIRRLGFLALAVLFLAAIERTQTAAAFGGMALLVAGLAFTTSARRHLWLALPAAFIAFLALVRFSPLWSYTLGDLRTPLEESTIGVRVGFWKAAADMAHDHPLAGVGAGGFGSLAGRYRTPESFGHPRATPVLEHAHCFPLEVLTETGPVGLLLAVWLGISLLALSLGVAEAGTGYARMMGRGILAGLLALFGHSLVGVGLSYVEVQGMLWAAAGLAMALSLGIEKGGMQQSEKTRSPRLVAALLGVLVLGCGWVSAWRPLEAQMWLSRGIQNQEAASDGGRPHSERRESAASAIEDFQRVLGLAMPGRAGVPAALHLAATLDLRASTLASSPEERRLDWEAARRVQKTLLEERPEYGVVLRTLAQVSFKLGKDEDALRAAEAQLTRNPFDLPSYEVWMLAARTSGRTDSLPRALGHLQQARARRPDDLDLLYVETRLLDGSGMTEEARRRLKELERACRARLQQAGVRPEDRSLFKPRVYLATAVMRDRPEEARQLCLFVLSLNPNQPEARWILQELDRIEAQSP
ncbi:MAG: O-antigen ligase family protein [Planctomycetes bacterium]|nr:O-antigen ligase family protein [Planctomycetota bacterium]